MREIVKIESVSEFNRRLGVPDRHPLVSVINFSASPPRRLFRALMGVYGIFIREDEPQDVVYGTSNYAFNQGTLIALAPGQIGGAYDTGSDIQRRGWALLFDAELLRGTPLARKISKYSFFSYEVSEALRMTEPERDVIVGTLKHLSQEIDTPPDEFSSAILVSYIEVLLNHCMRFYGRQFSSKQPANRDILTRFERLLEEYFDNGEQLKSGIPTVQLCAERLALSPNYFSDLIKKETGERPIEHIRRFLIERVKRELTEGNKNISEIAYDLGFNYSHHLSRLFKKAVGVSPTAYVEALNLK